MKHNPFARRYVPAKAPTTEQVAAALLFGAGKGRRRRRTVAQQQSGGSPEPQAAGANPARPSSLKESAFQQQITDLADLYGWRWHHQYDSRRSKRGWPDLVLVKGERLVIAELKKDREYPTPEQREWLAALRQVPGIAVFLWRPRDWESIQALLTGVG